MNIISYGKCLFRLNLTKFVLFLLNSHIKCNFLGLLSNLMTLILLIVIFNILWEFICSRKLSFKQTVYFLAYLMGLSYLIPNLGKYDMLIYKLDLET